MTVFERKAFPWGALALALVLSAFLRLPSLDLPLDRDEGEYASLAWTWNQGIGLPYKDYLEQKPPLSILLNRVAFAVGGDRPGALRILALLWQLLSVAAFFVLLWRQFRGSLLPLSASLLYACLSVSARTQGLGANTESWMSLPLILALHCILGEPWERRWFASGLFFAVAALAKQSALPAAILFPLLMEENWKERGQALVRCLLGLALIGSLCLLYFALQNAGPAFWNCVVSYNLSYAAQGFSTLFGNLWVALWNLGREDLPLWIALGLGLWLLWKHALQGSRLYWIWLLATLLGALMGGRAYPHYFQPLAAPLAALSAVILSQSPWDWFRNLVFGAYAFLFVLGNFSLWTAEDGAARSQRLFGIGNFAEAEQIAEVVDQNSPEGSKLFVWGSEAELFFLSQRAPASRFLFDYPFTGEAPPWPGGEEELVQALEDPKTETLVLMRGFDYHDAMERRLGERLEESYHINADWVPGIMIGIRKH